MKWYQPYNLSVPLLIMVGCIAIGAVQGSRRADKILAASNPPIENPDRLRSEIRARLIGGNLMIGGPFALVLFFALMPLNRKHREKRSQNQQIEATG